MHTIDNAWIAIYSEDKEILKKQKYVFRSRAYPHGTLVDAQRPRCLRRPDFWGRRLAPRGFHRPPDPPAPPQGPPRSRRFLVRFGSPNRDRAKSNLVVYLGAPVPHGHIPRWSSVSLQLTGGILFLCTPHPTS